MTQFRSIFLSHSHKDKPFVHRLAEDLTCRGVRVWLDEAEMEIGDSLIAKIGDAIENMDYVGAVLSKNSVKSPWVTRELEIALNHEIIGRRVKVLPLVIDDCAIPPFLNVKVYGDFRDESRYESTFEILMRRLCTFSIGVNSRSPFEIKLLVALNELRIPAVDFSAEGNAQRFLDGLNDLGNLIRTSPSSLLIYKSVRKFQRAYNSVAKISGRDLTTSLDEIRKIMTTLVRALDKLSIEVGIQALLAADAKDREYAARTLGIFGPTAEGAVKPLMRSLNDPSDMVRMAAAWALTAIGTEEAIQAVESHKRS